MENKRHHKTFEELKLLPRRWFPLWILDGYILREFLIKYSILLLVFAILFILNDVYRDISDFLDAGASWRDTVAYLAYRLPGNIRFVLPISMLLGCMWTMATFGKNMEVTAMRASGVSLFRCGGSIFVVGLIVTGVNIYFNEALVPQSQRNAEEVLARAAKKITYDDNYLAFRSMDHRRQWLFQTFLIGNAQERLKLRSDWGSLALGEKLLYPKGLPAAEIRRNLAAVLPAKAEQLKACVTVAELREFGRRELAERNVDLLVGRALYDPKNGSWCFSDGSCFSYDRESVSGSRSGVTAGHGITSMHRPIKFKKITFSAQEIPESPTEILNSVQEKDDVPTLEIGRRLYRSPDMPDRVRAIYRTVFYYRIAFPWACFLAVFLGIPLATKNERTGSMIAIITAIALIVIYIVVAQIFLVLGKGGMLNPVFAGLAPTIGFIVCGVARVFFDKN